MPFGTPVVGNTIVGVRAVVVVGATTGIGFFFQVLGGDGFIKEVDTLACVSRVKSLSFGAPFSTIILALAAAFVPVVFLVHRAFFQFATATCPFLSFTGAKDGLGHEFFLPDVVFSSRKAFAEFFWVQPASVFTLPLALLRLLAYPTVSFFLENCAFLRAANCITQSSYLLGGVGQCHTHHQRSEDETS